MKLKLIVLAGAKEGLEIPLKKDKFLIGRAKECALCAGSEAISRRHCAIIRRETGYTVRDLGSRNGTHVNDEKITAEVPLKAGDELRVGPLKFRIAERRVVGAPRPPAFRRSAPPTADKPRKQPPVKDVADVVQRTISNSDSTSEDDVSRWLLDMADDVSDTLKETRSMRAEETSTTMNRVSMTGDTATVEDVAQLTERRSRRRRGSRRRRRGRRQRRLEVPETRQGRRPPRKRSQASCHRARSKRRKTAATRPPTSSAKCSAAANPASALSPAPAAIYD